MRNIESYVAAVRVEDVSRHCEVMIDPQGRFEAGNICGAPTAYWYPAMGGGAMALCAGCAERHQKHAAEIGLTPFRELPVKR